MNSAIKDPMQLQFEAIQEKYLAVKKEYEQAYAEYKKWAEENPDKVVVDDDDDAYEFKMEE